MIDRGSKKLVLGTAIMLLCASALVVLASRRVAHGQGMVPLPEAEVQVVPREEIAVEPELGKEIAVEPELFLTRRVTVATIPDGQENPFVPYIVAVIEGMDEHPMITRVPNGSPENEIDYYIWLEPHARRTEQERKLGPFVNKTIILNYDDTPVTLLYQSGGKARWVQSGQQRYLAAFKRSFIHQQLYEYKKAATVGKLGYSLQGSNYFPTYYPTRENGIVRHSPPWQARYLKFSCSLRKEPKHGPPGEHHVGQRTRVLRWLHEFAAAAAQEGGVAVDGEEEEAEEEEGEGKEEGRGGRMPQLAQLAGLLHEEGVDYRIGTTSGKRGSGDEGYSATMLHSKIVVTCNPSKWEGDWRLAEALFSGALVMVDDMWTPKPVPLLDGVHVVYYSTLDGGRDLMRKLEYYLRHDDEARRIGEQGQEYAFRHLQVVSLADYVIRTAETALLGAEAAGNYPYTGQMAVDALPAERASSYHHLGGEGGRGEAAEGGGDPGGS